MAGIIARITRSNRERLDKKKSEISTAKSNYTLIPFDDHFVPEVSMYYTYILFSIIYSQGHNWLPKTGWASSNAARRRAAFYSASYAPDSYYATLWKKLVQRLLIF